MLRYYFRLGLLSIRANPALSALMIAAIAIGIGACMTIVTVRHVMADNPIEHKNDRLFHVQVDNWNPNDPYGEPNEPPEQVTYLDATALLEASRAHRQVVSDDSRVVLIVSGAVATPVPKRTPVSLSPWTHEQVSKGAGSAMTFPRSLFWTIRSTSHVRSLRASIRGAPN